MILFNPAAIKSSILYLLASAALAIFIDESSTQIDVIEAWIFAVNIMLISVMAKDKFSAIVNFGRTPEGTLLWLAVAGGYPGLFLARFIFNHKTTKPEFIKPMWGLLILQLSALFYYFVAIDPSF